MVMTIRKAVNIEDVYSADFDFEEEAYKKEHRGLIIEISEFKKNKSLYFRLLGRAVLPGKTFIYK